MQELKNWGASPVAINWDGRVVVDVFLGLIKTAGVVVAHGH